MKNDVRYHSRNSQIAKEIDLAFKLEIFRYIALIQLYVHMRERGGKKERMKGNG